METIHIYVEVNAMGLDTFLCVATSLRKRILIETEIIILCRFKTYRTTAISRFYIISQIETEIMSVRNISFLVTSRKL
jgi:hypothetical protein